MGEIALTVVAMAGMAYDVRRFREDRRYDRTEPALCWIGKDIEVNEIAPGRFRAWAWVTPWDKAAGKGLPSTPFYAPGDPAPTREQALARGQAWRDGDYFPCFYDPADVHFVTTEAHGDSAADVAILALWAAVLLVGIRSLLRELFGDRLRELDAVATAADPSGRLRAPPLSRARRRRLAKAREHFPDPWPDDWSRPLSPPASVVWEIRAGDVIAMPFVFEEATGFWLHVVLAAAGDPRERVSDDRAAAILGRFRGVGDFAEIAEPPKRLVEAYPGARGWIALPHDVAAKMVPPPKLPAIREQPLNPHLAAVRRHFPEKLPFGWSVPLAVTEVHDGWDQGGWLFHDDDACVIVMLTTSRGRVKLAVLIHHLDGSPVDEARAMDVLKHFRGITEFVQTETDDEDLPGARAYLGELDATGPRVMLN